MSQIKGKKIVLAVTGSIAAYKAAYLCSLLKKRGADIYPVMTPNATFFLGPATLSSLAGNKTIVRQYEQGEKIYHISLARSADAVVIAPASANTISKLARGICDNFLTTTALSADCPVLIAPAMNHRMYLEDSVRENIKILSGTGKYLFIGPQTGDLACGEKGLGKMSEPEAIADRLCFLLVRGKDLEGKKVLISAGGTREYIDPVRYISNLSSGKMGAALAEEAAFRGADRVVLVTASGEPNSGRVEKIQVQTSKEMKEKMLDFFDDADITIMAAAVSDIVPEQSFDYKLTKKDDILSKLKFKLNQNILNILASEKKPGQLLVGFAAEYGLDMENVQNKKKNNIDAVIANDISRKDSGMGSEYNEVTMLIGDGRAVKLEKAKKRIIARKIWDSLIENLIDKGKT